MHAKKIQFRMVHVDVTDCAFCCLVQGAAGMPDMTRVARHSFVVDSLPIASVIHSVEYLVTAATTLKTFAQV